MVVTGASGGVGRALVDRLQRHAHVVSIDLDPEPPLGATHIAGDARDPAVVDRAAEAAESIAPLSGWVCNAAIFRDASLVSATADEIAGIIDTHVRLAVVSMQRAVRHFATHGRHGSIVTVSSHQAVRPVRGALPYAAAKAALEGLTRAAAVDHGRTASA